MVTITVIFYIPFFLNYSEVSNEDIAVLFLQPFSVMQMVAWFALLHFSFYNISSRINSISLLIIDFSKPSEKKNKIQKTSRKCKSQLQFCCYLFNQLSAVFSLLNNIFSLPVLLIFTTLMMCSVTNLYFILYDFLIEQSVIHFAIPTLMILQILYVFQMLIILHAADFPLKEVSLFLLLRQPSFRLFKFEFLN